MAQWKSIDVVNALVGEQGPPQRCDEERARAGSGGENRSGATDHHQYGIELADDAYTAFGAKPSGFTKAVVDL